MENKITIKEWLELHPYNKPAATDNYYLNISNDILDIWEKSNKSFTIPENLTKRICLYITAYFEDVISDFGLWRAFINKNQLFYDKWLPFYTQEEEYFEDEINVSDIKFIIWYSIQQLAGKATHKIFPPYIKGLDNLSKAIYDKLNNEFEKAPINENIEKLFSKEDIYNNFAMLKQTINWFFSHCYLIEPSTQAKIFDNQNFINNQFKNANPEQKNILMYGLMQDTIYQYPCGPLAMFIKEWLCAIVGKDHVNFENYRNIETIPSQHWLVESIDNNKIRLSNIQKNKTIDMEKSIFRNPEEFKPGETVLVCGFIKYKDNWEVNGIVSVNNIKMYSNIQKQPDEAQMESMHKAVYDRFIQSNNGTPIVFLKNLDEMKQFLKEKMGWPDNDKESMKHLEDKKDFVIFATEEKGLMIVTNIADCIKHPNNEMYNEEAAKQKSFFLFVNKGQCPIELLEYLTDNDMLPDASMITDIEENNYEKGKVLLKENCDFIERMFLNEYYWGK